MNYNNLPDQNFFFYLLFHIPTDTITEYAELGSYPSSSCHQTGP